MTTVRTATGWQEKFGNALAAAVIKAGVPLAELEKLSWEGCDTDRTWGDRSGLVFFGASEEVCERAAKFFETWASRNLRKMNVVGGYERQESIKYEGEFYWVKFTNGAKGWYRLTKDSGLYRGTNLPVETKRGWATSYVYYPCAD